MEYNRVIEGERTMPFEFDILNWIQDVMQCDFLDWFMAKFTLLGEAGIIWIALAVAMIITKKYRKYGFLVLAGLLLGLIIGNGIVKNVVMRARPFQVREGIKLLISAPGEYSFPSGHAQSSFIAATIITLTNKKFGYAVIPIAVIMAFSRLYLYVHFPTDILAGIIMGIAIGCFTFFVGKKVLKIDSPTRA